MNDLALKLDRLNEIVQQMQELIAALKTENDQLRQEDARPRVTGLRQ